MPIGCYVADFACPQAKLVIEVDGSQHAERVEQDAARTLTLAMLGYRVVRYWNDEVLMNREDVLADILRHLMPSR